MAHNTMLWHTNWHKKRWRLTGFQVPSAAVQHTVRSRIGAGAASRHAPGWGLA